MNMMATSPDVFYQACMEIIPNFRRSTIGLDSANVYCLLKSLGIISPAHPDSEMILDYAHIDAICSGDEDLQVEMLALFVLELLRLKDQFEFEYRTGAGRERVNAMSQLSEKTGARKLQATCREILDRHQITASDVEALFADIDLVVRQIESLPESE